VSSYQDIREYLVQCTVAIYFYLYYNVAHTIDCVCSKMLNHGLNHGLFLSLFKLIPCPINWIVCVPIQISYLNSKAVLALPKTAHSAQTHKSISFIWIVWSTLYVHLWPQHHLNPHWHELFMKARKMLT
jgi:hypothetical protein